MFVTSDPERPAKIITDHFLPDPPARLGVAVSGGGDSLALLHLLADWAVQANVSLAALTVDHRLRPEAAQEAEFVARVAAACGVPHQILYWRGWDGAGNLSDQARRARYNLMSEWAEAQGIEDIALGHTLEDQAETLLMRLGRAAGIDGLAAMAPRRATGPITWHRPLLAVARAELREVLHRRDQAWIEDPSNEDRSYARVRLRQALPQLAPLGLTAGTLATVAENLAAAREALDWSMARAAGEILTVDGGDVIFTRPGWENLHPEIARRLLTVALCWVGSAEYPPRRQSLARAIAALEAGESTTLHGCRMIHRPKAIRITREFNAVAERFSGAGVLWDGRWQITGPWVPGVEVRALGERGLSEITDWRAMGRPHASQIASPAIWRGEDLLAAPLAGIPRGWSAEPMRDVRAEFARLGL